MFDFLNIKVSSFIGILLIIVIAGTFGAMIFLQLYKLMTIRFDVTQIGLPEEPPLINSK